MATTPLAAASFSNEGGCYYFCPNDKDDGANGLDASSSEWASMKRHYGRNDLSSVPTREETEKLIAKAMTELSVQDRETALEHVHGVVTTATGVVVGEDVSVALPSEVVEMEERQLNQMLTMLQQQSSRSNMARAYHVAKSISMDYAHDRRLHLSFLRAFTEQNPKQPAQEAVRYLLEYWNWKLHFFGREALCRDITLDDMDADDLLCLQAGSLQYIGNDRANRPIAVVLPWIQSPGDNFNFMKVIFYTFMTTCPEMQPHNSQCVGILYSGGKNPPESSKIGLQEVMQSLSLLLTLPCKVASIHLCMGPFGGGGRKMIFSLLTGFSSFTHSRSNVLSGSDLFLHYELRRFGIDASSARFPVTQDGDFKPQSVQLWLEERRQIEARAVSASLSSPQVLDTLSTPTVSTVTVYPTDSDVLFGRGMTYQYHPGNVQFRQVLEQHFEAYNDATRKEQQELVHQLYRQFAYDMGVRFLKLSSCPNTKCGGHGETWVEETDKIAVHQKIKYTFRSIRQSYRKTAVALQPQG
jgi:hypothetical protein